MSQKHAGDRWQVWMRLDNRARAVCEIYGMRPNDLIQHALEQLIEGLTKKWGNLETYAVFRELRSNPEWAEMAYDADDYKEWLSRMNKRGLTKTKCGVSIKDRKIARRRIDPEIRRIRRDEAKS